ncbi:general transcriptional repressor [Pelomyxa schiedti]|nr:general transcriptional repressor [Pelomyxa schiedti]
MNEEERAQQQVHYSKVCCVESLDFLTACKFEPELWKKWFQYYTSQSDTDSLRALRKLVQYGTCNACIKMCYPHPLTGAPVVITTTPQLTTATCSSELVMSHGIQHSFTVPPEPPPLMEVHKPVYTNPRRCPVSSPKRPSHDTESNTTSTSVTEESTPVTNESTPEQALTCTITTTPSVPPPIQPRPQRTTHVEVVNEDCLVAASRLKHEGLRPLVLNMASPKRPGGGYMNGANGQEENLFRRSNYFQILEDPENVDRKRTWGYPLPEFGAVYSAGVSVFRASEENGYAFLGTPEQFDFIALSAYISPKLVPALKYWPTAQKNEFAMDPKFADKTKDKLSLIFETAWQKGYDSLVLSAFGCGAFRNPPLHMAYLFKEVMAHYQGAFARIIFAILDDHKIKNHNPRGNFVPFKEHHNGNRTSPGAATTNSSSCTNGNVISSNCVVGQSPSSTGVSLNTKLVAANEQTWLKLGTMNEALGETDRAMECYENVLKHNPRNTKALAYIAFIFRQREQYPKAAEYFQRILNIDITNGEIWGALGHVHLLQDELQKAYSAYQQALYHLDNPKDPNLWYGIGILYERFGSNDHAEEAFMAVLKMDPDFEKASEIHYRLGMLYKQQPSKLSQALESFQQVCTKPPHPLSKVDIWTHIGNVYELQKEYELAKDSYEHALKENPTSPKQTQQLMILLGWLNHYAFSKTDDAIDLLTKATQQDLNDPQSAGQAFYLLGRCHMAQMKYRKAYQAYQQAVYQDAKSSSYWCSIGILYYKISQYRDALDAFTKSIKLGPALSEVWYNLGTLYEACNQIPDAIDACKRAAEIDPNSKFIQQRLAMLKNGEKRESLEEDKQPPLVIEPILSICSANNAPTKSGTPKAPSGSSAFTPIDGLPGPHSNSTPSNGSMTMKRESVEDNGEPLDSKGLQPMEMQDIATASSSTSQTGAPSPTSAILIPNTGHTPHQHTSSPVTPPPSQTLPNTTTGPQQMIPPIAGGNSADEEDSLSRKRQHHPNSKHTPKRSKVQEP